ncbi:MAG: hypothetical protein QM296_08485 [Bacillota bacterium]|nr:hypothetical protein [Bacillota bacterium]
MDRLICLTGLLLKGSPPGEALTSERKRRRIASKVGRFFLYLFLTAYLLFAVVMMSLGTIRQVLAMGHPEIFPALILLVVVVLTVFAGFFYVISAFYHSNDIERLLVLPVRARDIVAAKFIQVYLYELAIGAVICLPSLGIYGVMSGQSWYWWPLLLLVVIALPILPLAVISVVTMLFMRFTPFARDKDRFMMVTNILSLLLMLAFFYASGQGGAEAGSQAAGDEIGFMISETLLRRLAGVGRFVPGLPLGYGALTAASVSQALLSALGFVGVAVASAAVAYFAADLLYARAIVAVRQHGSRRKRLSSAGLQRATRSRGIFTTLIVREWQSISRSPTFLMNSVLSALIMPLMMVISLVASGDDGMMLIRELSGVLAQLGTDLESGWGFMFAGATALGLMVGASGSTSATALSREGQTFWMMKVIPVSYHTQIAAKLLLSLIIAAGPIGLLAIVAVIVLRLPLLFAIPMPLFVLAGAALGSLFSFVFDLFNPKLDWETETQAAKNNLNALWGTLLSFLLMGVVLGSQFLLIRFMPTASILVSLGLQTALVLLLLVFVLTLLYRQIPRRMRRIEV